MEKTNFEDIAGLQVNVQADKSKYQCCICESFLLRSPIFLNPRMGFICGYCFQDRKYFLKKGDMLLPQKLYEDFALSVVFPCDFCEKFTIFNAPSNSHELQCKKRIFHCPISKVNRWFLGPAEACEWQDIDGKSMVPHVRGHHREYILQGPTQLNIDEVKDKETTRNIFIAILSNRQIISITTELDEEKKCLIIRCRSNKVGSSEWNHRCRVELKPPGLTEKQYSKLNVYPLGAKIMESRLDFCRIWYERLKKGSIVRFHFEPTLFATNPNADYEYDLENDHDYHY